MVRRVGFNDSPREGSSAAQLASAAAGDRPGSAPAVGQPEVRRNWTRIVIQCFWVDLWLIAGYETGRVAVRSLAEGDHMFSIYGLLFAIVVLGAILSGLKLLRLLRGQPVATGG